MIDEEKAWMARATKRAWAQKRLDDHIDEITEKYGDHTNGCSCAECELVKQKQGGG